MEEGVVPPPTHSEWAELGDADHDGVIEHPALAFPEVACPLGVYSRASRRVFQREDRRVVRPGEESRPRTDFNPAMDARAPLIERTVIAPAAPTALVGQSRCGCPRDR